ncbi:hypothetical protein ACAL45_003129 [Listeria monocytogenes]
MNELKVVDITGGKGVIFGDYTELLKIKKMVEKKVKAPIYATIEDIDDRFHLLAKELDKLRKTMSDNTTKLLDTPQKQQRKLPRNVRQELNPAYVIADKEAVKRAIREYCKKDPGGTLSPDAYRDAYSLLEYKTGYNVYARPRDRRSASQLAKIVRDGMCGEFIQVLKAATSG